MKPILKTAKRWACALLMAAGLAILVAFLSASASSVTSALPEDSVVASVIDAIDPVASASADSGPCQSTYTKRYQDNLWVGCTGGDNFRFTPEQVVAYNQGATQAQNGERPIGVAGGGNAITRGSLKATPGTKASAFEGAFGGAWGEASTRFGTATPPNRR